MHIMERRTLINISLSSVNKSLVFKWLQVGKEGNVSIMQDFVSGQILLNFGFYIYIYTGAHYC